MVHWYLVQVKPNSYRKAERNLNRQGFHTFLPVQQITVRNFSKFNSNFKPLFPGYLFVSFELDMDPWRKINSTSGVSRIVCCGGEPRPLPLKLMSGLMSRCDQSGRLLPTKAIFAGDSVELLSGAFANFVATVETIDSEQRIWVLMELMGQLTRVQVASEQLQERF